MPKAFKVNFCSECGSSQLVFVVPDGDQKTRFVCRDCKTIHYQNPNMVVGCLIVEDEKVLLAKRGIEPRLGYWNLPCGFLENDETVEEGAKREVLEETGAVVKLSHLHCVYSLPKANQVYLIFFATRINDTLLINEESTEVKFFHFDEIPWDDIAFSSNTFAIKKYINNSVESSKTHLGHFVKKSI